MGRWLIFLQYIIINAMMGEKWCTELWRSIFVYHNQQNIFHQWHVSLPKANYIETLAWRHFIKIWFHAFELVHYHLDMAYQHFNIHFTWYVDKQHIFRDGILDRFIYFCLYSSYFRFLVIFLKIHFHTLEQQIQTQPYDNRTLPIEKR